VFLLNPASDFAGEGHLLGRFGGAHLLVIEDHRRPSVGEEEGVRGAGGVAGAILEAAVQGRRPGAQEAAVGQAIAGRRGRRDRDRDLFQRPTVAHCRRVGNAAGQVATVDRDRGWLARFDDAGMDGVDPGRGADTQAIEVFGSALRVGEFEDAHQVVAVLGENDVREGVVFKIIAVDRQQAPTDVVDLDTGMGSAVDAGGQAVEEDALPLLAGEDVIIDVGRGADDAVDRAVEFDALGLVDVVVGLLLLHFSKVADDESAGVADAPTVDDADVVNALRTVRRNGDGEAGDALFRPLRGWFLGVRRGRFGHRDGGGLDAGVAEEKTFRVFEVGAGDGHLDGGADLASSGQDGVEARRGQGLILLSPGGAGQPEDGQREAQGR
jgi:hypothetical protein